MLSKLFAPVICSKIDICTQLFVGKLTNHNWVYYKVDDNIKYRCIMENTWNESRYGTQVVPGRRHAAAVSIIVLSFTLYMLFSTKDNKNYSMSSLYSQTLK